MDLDDTKVYKPKRKFKINGELERQKGLIVYDVESLRKAYKVVYGRQRAQSERVF